MKQSMKLVVISTLGTALEWAEFTFYIYMAKEMSQLFFSSTDPRIALIATLAIFAASYLIRPLGALVFGHIGDRYGRRIAMQYAMLLMGLSAIGVGLLPTYSSVGMTAPILLLILRCLQGLAVSGELNGATVFLCEHAKKNSILSSSWPGWAGSVGMVVGGLAATIISLPGMPNWSWRIPFLLGAVICVCGYYLRKYLDETPEFIHLQEQGSVASVPIKKLFMQHRKYFLMAVLLAACFGIYIYVGSVYYAAYLAHVGHLVAYQMKLAATTGQLTIVLVMPFIAMLATMQSMRKILMVAFSLFLVVSPFLFWVPFQHSFKLVILAQILFGLVDACIGSVIFKYLNDLFPADVRYTGASLSWNVSMALFAGTAPMMAELLQHWLTMPLAPALYMMAAGMVAVVALLKFEKDVTIHDKLNTLESSALY